MAALVPLAVLAVTLAVGFATKRLLFQRFRRWTDRTKHRAALLVTQALEGPFMIWVLILGLHLATEYSPLPERLTHWVGRTLMVLWVASLTFMAARLAGDLVRLYGNEVSAALPVTTLTQNLAQLAVVIVGIVILLGLLGVPLSAPLTALGVGGLAVALALQETLSNLFAGFYIAVAGQIRVGDYIKLNTGEEGYVIDISWRNTSIRVLANNLIIIPNSKLAQAIVTNYYLPEKRMAVQIPIAVAYDCDPEQVERILTKTAQAGAKDIPGFGEFALNFTLGCHVAEFVDQFVVQHELRKRIVKRFREEGIQIPFPSRTIYMREHESNRKATKESV